MLLYSPEIPLLKLYLPVNFQLTTEDYRLYKVILSLATSILVFILALYDNKLIKF